MSYPLLSSVFMTSLNATVISSSRTLNEDLFKNHSWETLTSAVPMYIHGVSKMLGFFIWSGNGRDSKCTSRRKWRIKLNQLDGSTACLRIPHSHKMRAPNTLKPCAWKWFGEPIWLKTLMTLFYKWIPELISELVRQGAT